MPSITAPAICCFVIKPRTLLPNTLSAPSVTTATAAPVAQALHDLEERCVRANRDEPALRQVGQRVWFLRLPRRPQYRVPGQEADEPVRPLDQEAGDLWPLGRDARKVLDAVIGRHVHESGVHDIPCLFQRVEVRLEGVGDVVTPAGELLRVDALAVEHGSDSISQGHGDGHRDNHGVVQRHLVNHHDGGQGRPGGPADHPGHPGDGKRGRVDRQFREKLAQDQPVDPSQRAPQEQRGGEDAAQSTEPSVSEVTSNFRANRTTISKTQVISPFSTSCTVA